ncbi:spore coat U domain-containing protein [Acidovorax sp. GBBC 3334]|uniref:spore coat protein U domain-containing protein n=1 Tax=Acidovorax sp. GBBC 3334 TaxID=2940496 RepID=UPI0023025E3F|nr:spore coat protein U domain-containing protein [Acidovorax sp. GBBC 3334]MDA8453680.1 spore coat U domain-containing protein [Acidovorax sp. GBBC 3334]
MRHVALIIFALFAKAALADTTTNKLAATSTLSATCSFSATSVNFGALVLPLSSQSAGGGIGLLCSRDAPYTIDLAYGGVYGQGKPGDGSYWTYWSSRNVDSKYFARMSPSGTVLEYQWAYTSGTVVTPDVAKSLGCVYSGASQCFTGTTAYDYGVMEGAAKGDSVAYSIFLPGDTTKVWNAGKNSYTGSGTGKQEKINFQAKIVPAQSGAAYPAPDFYADTVTATVKY